MEKRELKIGDVVQIKPGEYKQFGGLLMVVTEPKPWGAQGYVLSAHNIDAVRFKGKSYLRPLWKNMEYVGHLHFLDDDLLTAIVED